MIGQKGMPAHYGGVERHVHDLSARLVKHGHAVTVYGRKWYTKTDKKTIDGVQLVHTPSIHTKHLDAITGTFTATIHALFSHFDIIHYHGVGPSLLSWIPRLFSPRTKVITTFHSIDRYHQKWENFAKFFLRLGERTACLFAHETITISQSLTQYCENEYNKKTVYIPNGVTSKEIPTDTSTLKKYGLTKNNFIVMVSRLVPHKGAHVLIEAFHNLKANNPQNTDIQNLKLVIVGGTAYTDDYVKKLHIQASGVNDIIFTDFQSGEILDQIYAHSKALIHPSFAEGLPITVLQAMSFSRPVLLSAIPEHMELTDDIRIFFKTNDVESLEKRLSEFLSLHKEEQYEIGQRNKKVIVEKYTWEALVKDVIAVYYKNLHKKYEQVETQILKRAEI